MCRVTTVLMADKDHLDHEVIRYVLRTTYSDKTHSQVRNGGLGMRPEPRICAPTLVSIICVYANKIMFVQGHEGEAGFKGPPGLRGSKVSGFILAVNLRWKWNY